MELIFRFEYLDVKGTVWSEVLHCPGSQDGLMVLRGKTVEDKASSLLHSLINRV